MKINQETRAAVEHLILLKVFIISIATILNLPIVFKNLYN